jgi:hypothetical protein
MLIVHDASHLFPAYLERGAGANGRGRGQARPLYRRQRLFTYKVARGKERNGGFLAGWRDYRDLCPALLKIEDRVCRVALREKRLPGL